MTAQIFAGKKVLITAGPTREAIDPVRYISNHSSGKMGYAMAQRFLEQGAEVVLVSGPVCLTLSHPNLTVIHTESASEMYLACCRFFENVDIAVFSAAVADYRPAFVAEQKIKKDASSFSIRLIKNIDIAAEFGTYKTPEQLSVGFALETNDELAHARGKLERKNFDLVVLNSMNDAGATFGCDTNKITLLTHASKKECALKSKADVAADIVSEVQQLMYARQLLNVVLKVA